MTGLVAEMQRFLGLAVDSKVAHSESRETTNESDKIGALNDICHESRVLNQCGLGLSAEEAYLVYTALKAFNKRQGATGTRFWGKIFGVERDYYVVEAETEEKDLDEQGNLEVALREVPEREARRRGEREGALGHDRADQARQVGQAAPGHSQAAPRGQEHQVHLQGQSRAQHRVESGVLGTGEAHGGSGESNR